MSQSPNDREQNAYESLRASLIALCFGLGVLAYLVAINHTEWFRIRPVSGTAAAMSHASAPSAPRGADAS